MNPVRSGLWLALLSICAFLPRLSEAQGLGFVVPEGRRHFIVLVDRSFSMARDMYYSQAGEKVRALKRAEGKIADILFEKGQVFPGTPWFRRGRDLVSIVHFGIDTKPNSGQAYVRLADATLGNDYAKLVMRSKDLTRQTLLNRLHPSDRTNLNILAWALPLGMDRAKAPDQPIQDTYVLMLNDAQLNDGGLILEKSNMGQRLGKRAAGKLLKAEQDLEKSVRLVDGEGLPNALFVHKFGTRLDPVVVTGFRAISTEAAIESRKLSASSPIRNLDLGWQKQGKSWDLIADLSVDDEFEGSEASIDVLVGGKYRLGKPFRLSGSQSVKLVASPTLVDGAGKVRLVVYRTVTNPMLGSQKIGVPFETLKLLPDSPSSARRRGIAAFVLVVLSLTGLGVLIWTYHHRMVASHFSIILPDYISSFELPSLGRNTTTRVTTREVAGDGEVAAWVVLPHRFLRRLFYRDTMLEWQGPLATTATDEQGSAAILNLPRIVAFHWNPRPNDADELSIAIVRPSRNRRLQIYVAFLAHPYAATRRNFALMEPRAVAALNKSNPQI